MVNKRRIRMLAESERLMDEGKVPWVMAPSLNGFERLPVSHNIMSELGLEQGQRVNQMILDAIAQLSMEALSKYLDDLLQKVEDEQLDKDFDFRSMMDNDNS